ncbi:hypothetical protein F4604DRAFT_328918 [Suillus subluteus]|nr:hypothetical protein F4604DRAFT_328918 [Suillus subluteus]
MKVKYPKLLNMHSYYRCGNRSPFTYPPNMTVVSDDPTWWPVIESYNLCSYFLVAACTVVIYDWAISLGKEYELIWGQRWSPVTILYLGVRYLGTPYTVIYMLGMPHIHCVYYF